MKQQPIRSSSDELNISEVRVLRFFMEHPTEWIVRRIVMESLNMARSTVHENVNKLLGRDMLNVMNLEENRRGRPYLLYSINMDKIEEIKEVLDKYD